MMNGALANSLPQRAFGPNHRTSVIGFGGGSLSGDAGGYGFGSISDRESIVVLERAYELGIRLFDTAPIYGFGESERRMGDFFRQHPSLLKDSTVVTKLGVDWDSDRKVRIDNRPETVRRMFQESLARLGLQRVQVYMIHWPDSQCPVEKTMEELVELKQEGLIESIAVSNFDPELIRRAETVAPIDVIQAPFCLLGASAKKTLLPVCGPSRGFMSYGTLAKGILSGTVTLSRKYDPQDFRARGQSTQNQLKAVSSELEEFFALAKSEGLTGSQLAVAWVLSHENVSTALCGSKNPAQIEEVVSGAAVTLKPETKVALDRISLNATPAFESA